MNTHDEQQNSQRQAHNQASLNRLLAHIEQNCSAQCEKLEAQAAGESLAIVKQARDRAAQLLRRSRERERGEAHERLQAERARQRMRLRRAWLERRRGLAERGMQRVAGALAALWNESVAVRSCWLARTLIEARQVLPSDEWRLECPADWDAGEGRATLAGFVDANEGVRIAVQPDSAIAAGFRLRSRACVVDLTPGGLLARRDRVAGFLLAGLADQPPELPHD